MPRTPILRGTQDQRRCFNHRGEVAVAQKQVRHAGQMADDVVKPVLVEYVQRWPLGDQDGPHFVYHGRPRIVDLTTLGQWPSLRSSLRTWKSAPTAHLAVIAVCDPQLLAPPLDNKRPVLCLLEDLMQAGWRRGTAHRVHDKTTLLNFQVQNPLANRDYLRCLLDLASLMANDTSVGLPSGQKALYYSCVLAKGAIVGVPIDVAVAQ